MNTRDIPNVLLWSMAATGLTLVLLVCALGFVFFVMWPDDSYHPDVRPPAVQPKDRPVRGR